MENFIRKFNNYDVFKVSLVERIITPNDFHEKIFNLLETSKEAYMISLYMGHGNHSKKLLDSLEQRKKKNLKTLVVLDANRGKRDKDFVKIIKEKGIEDLFRFHKINSLGILPYKARELIGVYHSKIYIFDKKIILSGANLDDTYFNNRIDR